MPFCFPPCIVITYAFVFSCSLLLFFVVVFHLCTLQAEWPWGFISILPRSELTETLMKLQLQYKCSCFLVDHFLEGRYVKMCSNRNWNNNISLHIWCNYCRICEQHKIYVALAIELGLYCHFFHSLVILHFYSDGVCDCCSTGTFAIKENGCQSTRVPMLQCMWKTLWPFREPKFFPSYPVYFYWCYWSQD